MSKLLKYADEINRIAIEKGFWDKERNKGEMVMLIISELGECLEAHRKNKRFPQEIGSRKIWHISGATDILDGKVLIEEGSWHEFFESLCKDTVEDELADVVIRILDYVKGWNIPMYERICRKTSTSNFGEDLLVITSLILDAYQREGKLPITDWGYVLAVIEAFSSWYNIDLETHIQWKMRYNSTREKLHGKAY